MPRANEVTDHEIDDVGECSDGAVSAVEVLGDPGGGDPPWLGETTADHRHSRIGRDWHAAAHEAGDLERARRIDEARSSERPS